MPLSCRQWWPIERQQQLRVHSHRHHHLDHPAVATLGQSFTGRKVLSTSRDRTLERRGADVPQGHHARGRVQQRPWSGVGAQSVFTEEGDIGGV